MILSFSGMEALVPGEEQYPPKCFTECPKSLTTILESISCMSGSFVLVWSCVRREKHTVLLCFFDAMLESHCIAHAVRTLNTSASAYETAWSYKYMPVMTHDWICVVNPLKAVWIIGTRVSDYFRLLRHRWHLAVHAETCQIMEM